MAFVVSQNRIDALRAAFRTNEMDNRICVTDPEPYVFREARILNWQIDCIHTGDMDMDAVQKHISDIKWYADIVNAINDLHITVSQKYTMSDPKITNDPESWYRTANDYADAIRRRDSRIIINSLINCGYHIDDEFV